MRLSVMIAVVVAWLAPAVADAPGPVEGFVGERPPGSPVRWSWNATAGADHYDIIGGALPVIDVGTASCRTSQDPDPTDTSFDDWLAPLPGVGLYVLVRANDTVEGVSGSYDSATGGEGRVNHSCSSLEAYFCVSDATGDSFVLKLTEPAKIQHAKDVVRGIVQDLVHVGATSGGGPVPWNPGWQFHIPPEAVYFFDQALEICDASIAAVDQGGLPWNTWCPWTSHIDGQLLHPDEWEGSTPEPFYCGPAQ